MYGIKLDEQESELVRKNWHEDESTMLPYIEGDPEVKGFCLILDQTLSKNYYFGEVYAKFSSYDDCDYKELPDMTNESSFMFPMYRKSIILSSHKSNVSRL